MAIQESGRIRRERVLAALLSREIPIIVKKIAEYSRALFGCLDARGDRGYGFVALRDGGEQIQIDAAFAARHCAGYACRVSKTDGRRRALHLR